MELFLKLLERFVVAHEKLASAQAQIALATPSVKAMQAKVDAEKTPEPEAPETKAPTAAEKKAAAAKAKAEAEAAKAKAESAKADAAAAPAGSAGGDFEYETLRALIGQTVQTGAAGTEKVKEVLAAYGVKSAKEAPADKWESMYNDLQESLAATADDQFA